MREPAPWPYSTESEWVTWRDYLDRVEILNVETLRLEAARELARIERCSTPDRDRGPGLIPRPRELKAFI